LAILALPGPGLTAHNEAYVAPRAAIGKEREWSCQAQKAGRPISTCTAPRVAHGLGSCGGGQRAPKGGNSARFKVLILN